jgi:hypothetical protein
MSRRLSRYRWKAITWWWICNHWPFRSASETSESFDMQLHIKEFMTLASIHALTLLRQTCLAATSLDWLETALDALSQSDGPGP